LCWHEALKGVFLRVKTWRYANESCNFTATPANLFKLEKYDCENISLNLILVIHLFMFLIEQLTFLKIVESGIKHHNPKPLTFYLDFFFFFYYITPVNNLPLGARKPQRFTNIYNEQYN
jgi:hypothetical protein